MSRLYYEESVPMLKKKSVKTKRGKTKDEADGIKDYLEKVAKIIPGEIIAGYMTVIGFVPNIIIFQESSHRYIYQALLIIFTLFTIWYMNFQAEEGKPKFIHILISAIAFIVWAYNISGNLFAPGLYDPAIASIILVLFSLSSGKIPLK